MPVHITYYTKHRKKVSVARKKTDEKERRNTQVVEPIRDKKDIQRIINYFDQHDKHKYAVIFQLGVYSGLRTSDLLGLKVKNVYHRDTVELREQKTRKAKQFPLRPQLQDLLNEFCDGRDPEEYLFLGKHDKPLDRIVVYKAFIKACKELEIKAHVGSYVMRKTFGYHHYRQFKDITLLQTIFNHYTPEVTKRYIGITQDEINESYLALNLDPPVDEVKEAKLTSKIRARRVASYCNNYLKNGGKTHRDFALTILELMED